ncbi:MAG: Holliday junction branch migration protein RuvA [Chitinivibrionales bacterium]|nr:Holliday junction branch migration protein RuvA [Chitinivibrionales bacterium]
MILATPVRFDTPGVSFHYSGSEKNMIDYIKGMLAEKSTADITVEAQGVGYAVSIPLSTYEKLPAAGYEIKILTHHYVREDMQKLFGFATKEERDVFRCCIGISSIGPKVALAILSGISVEDLICSVNLSDPSRLKSISGVGPKTAQRIVMELKGKLGPVPAPVREKDTQAATGQQGADLKIRNEAYEAMVSLGYADKQVQNAIARVEKVIDTSLPVEEWIKKALQVI